MTLIEIMVVLAIVLSIMSFAKPNLMSANTKIRKQMRNLAFLNRNLRAKARIKNRVYRIAFQLGTEEEPDQSYWVESAKGDFKLSNPYEEDDFDDEDEELEQEPDFEEDKAILKKPVKLNTGLKINQIEYSAGEILNTEGMAYLHYFPSGKLDEVAIQLQAGKKTFWTMSFHPLTGQSFIDSGQNSIEEIKDQ